MKKLKGMSLMEVIVAMFVFALTALLLMEIMQVVNTTMKSTDQLNRRFAYEAKYADNLTVTSEMTENAFSYAISYGSGGTVDMEAEDSIVTEYRTNYSGDANPINTGAHYRFMVYEHREPASVEYPGKNFEIKVKFVPYISSEAPEDSEEQAALRESALNKLNAISQVIVSSDDLRSAGTPITDPHDRTKNRKDDTNSTLAHKPTLNETAHTLTYQPDSLEDLSSGYTAFPTLTLTVNNRADSIPEGATNRDVAIRFQVNEDIVLGGTVYADQEFSESDLQIFQWVKIGLTENFYDSCTIEYDLNTGIFKPQKSTTSGLSLEVEDDDEE